MTLLLIALAVASGPSSSSHDAEYRRLSEEMDRMAKAGNWNAVEYSFSRLDALGVPHSFKVLLHAAFAAREAGDMALAKERLHAAAALRQDPAVEEWLWSIQRDYVPVLVAADLLANYRLVPEQLPFSPEHRRAVQFAMRKVEEDGYFKGLLPKGVYHFRPFLDDDPGRRFTLDLRRERQSVDLRTRLGPTKRDRRRRKRLDRRLERAAQRGR